MKLLSKIASLNSNWWVFDRLYGGGSIVVGTHEYQYQLFLNMQVKKRECWWIWLTQILLFNNIFLSVVIIYEAGEAQNITIQFFNNMQVNKRTAT